jgi:aminoglycoside phosphotransferase (APT) family kinase protein
MAATGSPADGAPPRADAAPRRPATAGGAGAPTDRPAPEGEAVGAVRAGEGLDAARLGGFLRARVAGLDGPMTVAQFHGGYANLTYLVAFGDRELVVRRPPRGELPPGAHDMAREHRVLAALAPVYDRAPRPLLFCDDPGVIGAPFLAVERRRGAVVRRRIPEALAGFPQVERRLALALVDALADLHRLDPRAIGLGDLGRPEGFAARQIEGWARRWQAARDRDLPAFEAVRRALAARTPAPLAVAVLHNDPKLDNAMFAPDDPDRVTSVFDWDMATTGDPAVDLGVLLGYFAADRGRWGDDFSAAPVAGDWPARGDLVERWLSRTGFRAVDAGWAEAFALWKLAVVLQQIYLRHLRGQTADPRFGRLGARVPELIDKAAEALE